jgi:hypothetical protein
MGTMKRWLAYWPVLEVSPRHRRLKTIRTNREWIRLRKAYGATGYESTRMENLNRGPEPRKLSEEQSPGWNGRRFTWMKNDPQITQTSFWLYPLTNGYCFPVRRMSLASWYNRPKNYPRRSAFTRG